MSRAGAQRARSSGSAAATRLIFVAATGLVGAVSAGLFGGIRINLTPSEPLGIWRIVPLDRPATVGDLVFVCPPRSASGLGLDRGYFRRGSCPDDVAPLIKTIAATAGARITIDTDVVIDGVALPHSRTAPRDGAGRPLAPWPGGIVPPGHIFLHSSFAGSYDSRYFGPAPETGLLGFARPLLTFNP